MIKEMTNDEIRMLKKQRDSDFEHEVTKATKDFRYRTRTFVFFACSACPPWRAKAFGVAFCKKLLRPRIDRLYNIRDLALTQF
jgi:hypothetical protein